ncbi:MAG: hypothetical protein ACREFD_14790 [Stellaceae bacterium]
MMVGGIGGQPAAPPDDRHAPCSRWHTTSMPRLDGSPSRHEERITRGHCYVERLGIAAV